MSQKANLRFLKNLIKSDENIEEYHKCKADLDETYENIAEGVKITSKCQWYKENAKSTKHFLNLEKRHAEKPATRR